jgi:hypothetical protein
MTKNWRYNSQQAVMEKVADWKKGSERWQHLFRLKVRRLCMAVTDGKLGLMMAELLPGRDVHS